MRIIERWKIWFFISSLVIIPGIISLFVWKLNPGIDFAGGTLIELSFNQNYESGIMNQGKEEIDTNEKDSNEITQGEIEAKEDKNIEENKDDSKVEEGIKEETVGAEHVLPPVQEKEGGTVGVKISIDQIKKIFEENEIKNPQISLIDDYTFLARSHLIDNEKYKKLTANLNEKVGKSKELRFETVGPTISRDLVRKAAIALILAVLAIVLYIAWAFRSAPKPMSSWKFGLSAIFALIHDILIIVGIFSILGHFLKVEVDNLFITALLTTLGFSVHDTIVVFDRIRENLRTSSGDFMFIANKSIAETMTRSINTSATTLFTLSALLIFGGPSIFWFVLALVIGIIAGTYSSIFIASVILVLWHRRIKKS